MRTSPSSIWRALSALGAWGVALIVLFEEWGWVPLARLMSQLARLPLVAWLERRVVALSPAVAFGVLFVPMLLLLPFKLGALWLIAGGRMASGVLLFVGAKIAGTGVFARLFMLTQPQLMRLAWFSFLYLRWVAWKDAMMGRVRATLPWRIMRALLRRVRRMTHRA